MMKLLPFAVAAVAEKRFLTKGASVIDGTNKNLLFDKAVNKADGTTAADKAISMTNGVIYMGGKDAPNSITGLTTGAAYMLKAPASPKATGNWKTHSRLIASTGGTAVSAVTDATLPSCDNMFIESKNAGAAVKHSGDIQASAGKGTASQQLKLTLNASASTLLKDDFVYMACKVGGKAHKSLKCGTTYKLGTIADTNDYPVLTSAGGEIKGQADHTTGVTYTDMFFVEVATATPTTLNVCTKKSSASRAAAFLSGFVAYALLM